MKYSAWITCKELIQPIIIYSAAVYSHGNEPGGLYRR